MRVVEVRGIMGTESRVSNIDKGKWRQSIENEKRGGEWTKNTKKPQKRQ